MPLHGFHRASTHKAQKGGLVSYLSQKVCVLDSAMWNLDSASVLVAGQPGFMLSSRKSASFFTWKRASSQWSKHYFRSASGRWLVENSTSHSPMCTCLKLALSPCPMLSSPLAPWGQTSMGRLYRWFFSHFSATKSSGEGALLHLFFYG